MPRTTSFQNIINLINQTSKEKYPDVCNKSLKNFHHYIDSKINLKNNYSLFLNSLFTRDERHNIALICTFERNVNKHICLEFIDFLSTNFSNYLESTSYELDNGYIIYFLPLKQIKNNIRKEKIKQFL